MRKFINLCEEISIDGDSEVYTLEKKIISMIRFAFEKVGLQINYNNYSVIYTHEDRMAEVLLEETIDGFSLTELNRLKETGLADEYFVSGRNGEIVIRFLVSSDLDNAHIA